MPRAQEGAMPCPNFAGKHAYDAFFAPQHYMAYPRRRGQLPELEVQAGIIFCYQTSLLDHVVATEEVELVRLFAPDGFYLLREIRPMIGVCGGFGIGAPVVTTLLEGFVALGTKRFVSIGT